MQVDLMHALGQSSISAGISQLCLTLRLLLVGASESARGEGERGE